MKAKLQTSKLKSIFLISLLMISNISLAESDTAAAKGTNPLFNQFNKPIAFGELKPEHFKDAVTRIIDSTKKSLGKIITVHAEERTFKNTMLALDDIYNHLNSIASAIDLLSNVLPDEERRKAALEQLAVISKFYNELQLNEDLYKAVVEYSMTPESDIITGYQKKFLTEIKKKFERNGFALPKEKRDRLKEIQNKIADISIHFNDNIESYNDSLFINWEESKGLPLDFLQARKTKDGYSIDLSYPSYYPFMKYCDDENARKKLYLKFTNRAPVNEKVLSQLLEERKKLATLLGYNSYAEYGLSDDRMAHDAETVWHFEASLTGKVRQKATKDNSELLAMKYGDSNVTNEKKVINPWEASYYTNKLLEQKYQVDGQKVKEYFELNNVLDGLFKITQHLFNLKFVEVKNPSVWHPDVRMFEVMKEDKMISRFYLDLYPRPNKYGHAACFGIIGGKKTPDGYQYPTAALVCNFPKPTKDKPALMPHSDVETFFHEFGHVLHNMLTTSDLYYFAGTNVAQDFVEAPSQIFENWAWEYDALKMFAKHYKTGEVLPQELFNKMKASKNAGSGLNTLQQVFYGSLDMTLHDKFDPLSATTSTTDVVKELQNKITLYPFLEGSHFQYSFGHLNGYGAGYYGYLWSKVYAQDMFSIFKKNGIMDQKTGIRYRDIILSKGASDDPMNLVKDFLGRNPNDEAYLKDLGL
ncbi:MAG TPA: M3 family metallopeptidase [Bacteroidia bacterium]|nr:M3 family metallopeptidase [Bacteroidia bacterium]